MHAHERIDPRRGPGQCRARERDDGRREIDAGIAEYEDDRDAREASLYDSCDDWSFAVVDDWGDDEEWTDDEMDYPEYYLMDDAHEPDDDDVHVRAKVQDGGIVIEIPVPANMSALGRAEYVEEITRRIASDFLRAGGGKVTGRQTKAAPTRPGWPAQTI